MRTLRRILITGANGFVGTHLRGALARTCPDASVIAGAADLRDMAAVSAMVAETAPDSCVHLAALSTVSQASADYDTAWAVNLHGTLHLARALRASAPACRLIFASSAEIYGGSFSSGRPLDESALLSPNTTYGATKAAADLALGAMAHEGLNVVRFRLFNHIGPRQSPAFVVSAFARQLAAIRLGRQAPAMNVGALDNARDFLDVRDVCTAYIAALTSDSIAAGIVLNIASGIARRIGDVLNELCTIVGVNVQVHIDQARLRPSDISFACGDASCARRLLNWSPAIPWHRTLADLLNDWDARLRSGDENVAR
jgi:GDP-4-dehydro-6-deoxy-D-mannose reductase